MNSRHEVLSKIKEDASEMLIAKLKSRDAYKNLMKKMIIQVSFVFKGL